MKIINANLDKAIAALRQCAEENKGKQTDTGSVVISDICTDVADYLERPADGRDKQAFSDDEANLIVIK